MTPAEARAWADLHRLEEWLALRVGQMEAALAAKVDAAMMESEAKRLERRDQ